MEKDQFLSLIKNYTSLDSEDLRELISTQKSYPYSQAIHNLASRAAANTNSILKEELLHLSAIYTTDRAVLKSIMTAPKSEPLKIEASLSAKANHNNEVVELDTSSIIVSKSDSTAGEFLLDNIFRDLEDLKKSKLRYEENMAVLEKETQVIESLLWNDPELALAIDTSVLHEHTLAEELKNKKEIDLADPKQKEQIEIIENYIKIQPGLPRAKAESINSAPDDLSDKNQHFADNVISETLVEILLKQGKKVKAIEVLKKLIWKFPQKKAYFAAQIEDLKK